MAGKGLEMTSTVSRSLRYMFQRNDGDASITHPNGGILIPVENGTFQTLKMSADYTIGNVFIQFFSGTADNPVAATPTDGTVTVEAGPYLDQWLMPSGTGSHVIDANTINAASDAVATYTPPTFDARVLYTRIILDNVQGVTFMVADHWRSIA